MRVPYYCPYCDHRSTRWWNLKVHIKRKHGEFLLGRSSDSNPLSPNNPYHNIGSATVPDNVGEMFQPRYLPQHAPLGTSQYSTSAVYSPLPRMDHQSYGTSLSRALKIEELKRLMSKYSLYHKNPDGIIRLAIYNSIKGDYTLLDDKLEQLRTIDSLARK